jgi:S-adenosylmethionine:tRNA ribosyltransferase-isomerase
MLANELMTRHDDTHPTLDPLNFTLPPELEAAEPPEVRGQGRDDVRLLISYRSSGEVVHSRFPALGDFLAEGDLLVLNTSGTLPAALPARRADGTALELHLSTHLPGALWTVELRLPTEAGTQPFTGARVGEVLRLPAGGRCTLRERYRSAEGVPTRLWLARLRLPAPLHDYLARHGFPIRYGYVRHAWPVSAYQTVYATEPGSAEMPSAGRAFTPALITRLIAHGVQVAPLLLHCGVASLEAHEPPYAEPYRVPAATARLVNATRAAGGRVIAVGTTVVRALESAANAQGVVHPCAGWTDLVITPERGIRVVDGLLTGLHEPRASHLAMLEALAGRAHLARAYAEALRERYLWHEFGDLHLLLP